jgi:hypothetical protein
VIQLISPVMAGDFPKLDVDLEVLESERNAALTKGLVDAMWSHVRVAVDSLASHVPSSVARNPPDNAAE